MLNFSFLDKHKKTVIFAVLFAVTLGTIFAFVITPPRHAIATEGFIIPADSPEAEQWATNISGIQVGSGTVNTSGDASGASIVCGAGAVIMLVGGILGFLSFGATTIIAGAITAAACYEAATGGLAKLLGESAFALFRAVVLALCIVLRVITHTLAGWGASWLSKLVTSSFFNKSILLQPGFSQGWAQVRDLSNMFIVLGFVVVGIAFALRIAEYGSKKVLISLILIALLVNFSGLFCGLIIDGSDMLTLHFLAAGGGNVGEAILTKFDTAYDAPVSEGGIDWNKLKADEDPTSYISAMVAFAFGYLLIAIVFLYLVVILVATRVIFGILFVLSPLAFFCWVFPATKKLWTKWWEEFIKWGLLGAQVAFFVWLASLMVTPNIGNVTSANISGTADFLAILVLLYVAVKIAKSSSAIGAGAVMGLATAGMGFALGASKKIAGAAWEKTGRNPDIRAARDKVSEWGNRIAESTGFAKEGHTAQRKAAKTAEARKQVDALRTSSSAGDKARFEQLVRTGRGSTGAAAIASANEHGDLAKILNPNGTTAGLNEMNARVKYATQFGHEKSDFEKKDYRLAEFNNSKINNALNAKGHKTRIDTRLTAMGLDPNTATAEQRINAARTAVGVGATEVDAAREEAVAAQLKSNLPQMSTGELGRIDHTHVAGAPGSKHYAFLKENFTPHMTEQLAVSGNHDLITAIKGHVGTVGTAGTLMDDQHLADVAGNKGEANRLQKIIDSIGRLP